MSSTVSGYGQIAGTYMTGWTSDTAHKVVGLASRHGNARYNKVVGVCGQSFNPGSTIDPQNVPARITLCGKCQEGIAPKTTVETERRLCTSCGETNLSKKSDLCSPCREIASWAK